MRIGTRIDDDGISRFSGVLYPIDKRALMVRLLHDNAGVEGARCRGAKLGDIIQRSRAVYLWLSLAEKVQVRAVQDQDRLAHRHSLAETRRTAQICAHEFNRVVLFQRNGKTRLAPTVDIRASLNEHGVRTLWNLYAP